MAPSRRPRRGFTLIELLVVIAVIMLLAALTLPALDRAMQLSRRAQCGSNLGQICRGLMLYANQFARYFVANRPRRPGCGDDDLSPLVTCGYILDIRVFACPATNDDPQEPEDLRHKPTAGGKGSYEYWGENNPGLRYPGGNSSILVVAHDEEGYGANIFIDEDNHGSAGLNVLFLDSHVDWVTAQEWWPGPNSICSRGFAEWAKVRQ